MDTTGFIRHRTIYGSGTGTVWENLTRGLPVLNPRIGPNPAPLMIPFISLPAFKYHFHLSTNLIQIRLIFFLDAIAIVYYTPEPP